jgi:hypothetical protein
MTDRRIGMDLYSDVLDVLERHGFAHGDDQHAGRAIFLIGDLAFPPTPSRRHGPDPESGSSVPEDGLDAVALTHAQVRTVLTSLDLAADWKRDRAGTCTYCADQPCFIRGLRLREARTYDQLAVQLLRDEQATRHLRRQAEPHGPPSQPGLAVGKEAGQ